MNYNLDELQVEQDVVNAMWADFEDLIMFWSARLESDWHMPPGDLLGPVFMVTLAMYKRHLTTRRSKRRLRDALHKLLPMLTRKLCVNADAEANNVKVQSLTRTIIREQRFRWYRVLFEDDWAQKISDIVEIVKGTSLWDFLTDKLVPRNKYILHAYVIDKRTQKSIAQELNLSTAYIQQRINSALWRIQWRIRHNTQLTEIFGLKDKGRPYRIRSYD